MDYNNNQNTNESYNYGSETNYDTYATETVAPVPERSSLSVAGLILGIIGFFLNPLYLVSVVGIILSIIGVTKSKSKGMAIAGIVLGALSLVCQIIGDLLITVFTAGIGVFVIFC